MLSDGSFCLSSQAYPPTELYMTLYCMHGSSQGSFIWEHIYLFTPLDVPASSLLGRSASPEAEIQGNPPLSSHRTRVSTSPMMSYGGVHGSHEHYERIECTYIGSCDVSHGMGMEVLNEAVDKLSTERQRSQWLSVNVDVATSSVKISDAIVSACI